MVKMQEQLVNLIVQRLSDEKAQLQQQFAREHAIKVARHFVLDNLLPVEIAEQIHAHFPKPKEMHVINSPGRLKLKYSHLKDTASIIRDINAAIQDPRVVAVIEEITGISQQIPDTSRFSGGVSALLKGYYINPHLDNSHNVEKKQYYRTVNVLYYISPDWKLENGGNYELWDAAVEQHIVVPSYFNRLVVMETNSASWHAVSPVVCNEPRRCVFNYYFSPISPEGREYFFDAPSFRPRPEQKIRRRIIKLKDRLFGKAW
ncbi:2OG-Fe(II) oxygenase [Legionella dresdenensis]|uniref:2OG-Fe(II) oxygenase n=1 Tax=Legionella dresdenensis TaxID=450200 RepID=A0ABV8CCK1_9GAMM